MAEQIEAKLYTYDPPIHEEQKSRTHYVIGHMVWQPYWICLKTYKNTPLKRSPGKGLQSLIDLFLVLCMVQLVQMHKDMFAVQYGFKYFACPERTFSQFGAQIVQAFILVYLLHMQCSLLYSFLDLNHNEHLLPHEQP